LWLIQNPFVTVTKFWSHGVCNISFYIYMCVCVCVHVCARKHMCGKWKSDNLLDQCDCGKLCLCKIQAFWDVMPFYWVSSSWYFQITKILQNVRYHLPIDSVTSQKTLLYFSIAVRTSNLAHFVSTWIVPYRWTWIVPYCWTHIKFYLRNITVVESGADEYNGELCGFMYQNNDLAQKVNTKFRDSSSEE
jgi:hypothetical protein